MWAFQQIGLPRWVDVELFRYLLYSLTFRESALASP